MAAAFRPVNSTIASETEHIMTPLPVPASTTSRPSTAPQILSSRTSDDGTTPTRANFTGVTGQRPLPSSPFPQAIHAHPSRTADQTAVDDAVQLSTSPPDRRDSMDVDMDDSDGEAGGAEDLGSDDESVNADGSQSSKKKKSQRFYCTEYPPCNLSFTRSEHLARHIRKHTGERPFQCHCSRRFSRLDNLRQHAQTVHVNEDIPIDSLAATGSRFQRQIRTDRVRQAGNRARASTGGSAGGPGRGHAKSLSTSSINSMSSVGSNYSAVTDARRRPPPLVMADPRSRPETGYYRPTSPSDFGTPTSSTFSPGQSSPRWIPGVMSPSSHARTQSMYAPGTRTPGRRLSVPSGVNPFQSPQGMLPGRPVFGGSGPMNSSNNGLFSPATSSLVSSPTTSVFSGRRDSISSTSDEAWRRRTWHPDNRYNANSAQLNNVANQPSMRPNPPPPIANPTGSQSSLRLPGIESFDPVPQHGSSSPSRQQPSPMVIDSHPMPRPPVLQGPSGDDDRRNLNMYDASLQRGLTRLDLSHTTPPRDSAGAWAYEAHKAVQAQAEAARPAQQAVRFEHPQPAPQVYRHPGGPSRAYHQHTVSAPSIASSREKRRGWYNGPSTVRIEEGQPLIQDPRTAHAERIVHPNFTGFSGFPGREQAAHHPALYSARQQQPHQVQQQQQQQVASPHQQQPRSPNAADPLRRLEALVAVATSEGSAAAAY